MKIPKDVVQGELFGFPPDKLENTLLLSKTYKEQGKVIETPIDYVSRKAIELRPIDFLLFFPEFQKLSPDELKKVKILDANRTLEAYFKREADSLTLIIESELEKLKDTAFHIEVQTAYDETMDDRIWLYNVLIKHKTKKPKVKSLLINLDSNPKSQLLGNANFGSIKLEYEVINLWELGYEEVKQKELLGLLPFTPYLKGGGQKEIREASEILKEKIPTHPERAEMIFLLAILAGRKYNTAGFQLLSSSIMNIEILRDDPTARQLVEFLYPTMLADAKTSGREDGLKKGREDGLKEGFKKATEYFMRKVGNVLSEEQIQQLLKDDGNLVPKKI